MPRVGSCPWPMVADPEPLRVGPRLAAPRCASNDARRMKILLTGAGGQIGHDLIGALVAQGHQVVSTDLAPRPPSHAHAGGVDWQRLDVTDAAAVQHMFTEIRPDLVFHLAAILDR